MTVVRSTGHWQPTPEFPRAPETSGVLRAGTDARSERVSVTRRGAAPQSC